MRFAVFSCYRRTRHRRCCHHGSREACWWCQGGVNIYLSFVTGFRSCNVKMGRISSCFTCLVNSMVFNHCFVQRVWLSRAVKRMSTYPPTYDCGCLLVSLGMLFNPMLRAMMGKVGCWCSNLLTIFRNHMLRLGFVIPFSLYIQIGFNRAHESPFPHFTCLPYSSWSFQDC